MSFVNKDGRNNKPYQKKTRFYEPPEEPLTEKQLERVLKKMENICVWYLTKSKKTRKELEMKLKERRYPKDYIDTVLDKLESRGEIDDKEYAEYFTHSRHQYDRLGKRAIENKLRMKGVSSEIIAEAVELIDSDNEYENGKILVERRARSTRNLDSQKRLEKLARMLISKGYDLGTAFIIVKEVLAELKPEEDAEKAEYDDQVTDQQ